MREAYWQAVGVFLAPCYLILLAACFAWHHRLTRRWWFIGFTTTLVLGIEAWLGWLLAWGKALCLITGEYLLRQKMAGHPAPHFIYAMLDWLAAYEYVWDLLVSVASYFVLGPMLCRKYAQTWAKETVNDAPCQPCPSDQSTP